MKEEKKLHPVSFGEIVSDPKVSSNEFFAGSFAFYDQGDVLALSAKSTLKDLALSNFLVGYKVLGDEVGYFFVGVKFGASTLPLSAALESMFTELSGILVGKFVNLVCAQTSCYLEVKPPEEVRSLGSHKAFMLRFLENGSKNEENFLYLIKTYQLKNAAKENIRIVTAFIPEVSKARISS